MGLLSSRDPIKQDFIVPFTHRHVSQSHFTANAPLNRIMYE